MFNHAAVLQVLVCICKMYVTLAASWGGGKALKCLLHMESCQNGALLHTGARPTFRLILLSGVNFGSGCCQEGISCKGKAVWELTGLLAWMSRIFSCHSLREERAWSTGRCKTDLAGQIWLHHFCSIWVFMWIAAVLTLNVHKVQQRISFFCKNSKLYSCSLLDERKC